MRKTVTTALLAAGLILSLGLGQAALAAGPAADAAKPGEDMFAIMDANKDGVLTKEEFAAHGMADDFAKYDKNGDGKVTRDEFNAQASSMGAMPGM